MRKEPLLSSMKVCGFTVALLANEGIRFTSNRKTWIIRDILWFALTLYRKLPVNNGLYCIYCIK
jgi:hypothetical protein